MYEIDMVNDCYSKLSNIPNLRTVILEVPYLSRCIDMVIVDELYNIITVEFKLKNWQQAILQAKDHSLGADEAYICIPKPKRISDKLIEASNKTGVGILFWNPDADFPFEQYSSAKSNPNRWQPWITSLKTRVNKISGEPIFKEIQI